MIYILTLNINPSLTNQTTFTNIQTAARNIKEALDHKYGPAWHCVIGEGFGYEVTYEAKYMLYLVFNNVGIDVYKC